MLLVSEVGAVGCDRVALGSWLPVGRADGVGVATVVVGVAKVVPGTITLMPGAGVTRLGSSGLKIPAKDRQKSQVLRKW